MQHLEAEAIEKEGMDHLAFLATCGSALRSSPPEACRILVTPFHLLWGNALTSALLSIPPGVSTFQLEPAPETLPTSATKTLMPSPQPKLQHHLPNWVEPFSPSESTSKVALEEPHHSKQKEESPLFKVLSRSHQEAFSRDSKLVWKAREEYFQEICPHFSNETCAKVQICECVVLCKGVDMLISY